MSSFERRKQKIFSFTGPVAATLTPFQKTGEVNLNVIDSYAEHLNAIGVKGVYLNGTSGECLSLTLNEKKNLAKKWIETINLKNQSMLTIVHISSTCINEIIELGKYCENLNVDAIAVLPPIYYRPTNVASLTKYLKTISDQLPDMPLIYYHIPVFTRVKLNIEEIIVDAMANVKTLVGMKFTSENIIQVHRIHNRYQDEFKIFLGFEETLYSGLAIGIRSAICGFFNLSSCTNSYSKMLLNVNYDEKKFHFNLLCNEQKKIEQLIKSITEHRHFIIALREAMLSEETFPAAFALGHSRLPVDH